MPQPPIMPVPLFLACPLLSLKLLQFYLVHLFIPKDSLVKVLLREGMQAPLQSPRS